MPRSHTHRHSMFLDVCRHEARHCGYLHGNDIDVRAVEVDHAGNGSTSFVTLELPELTSLYRVDRAGALDRVLHYVAGCLVGSLTTREVPDRADVAEAERYAWLWSGLTQQPAYHVLDRATRRAIGWIVEHRRPIEAFARELEERRCLCGTELQALLVRTFGPQPQASPAPPRAPRSAPRSAPTRAPVRQPAASRPTAAVKPPVAATPRHVWWAAGQPLLIDTWVDVNGAKHFADGRLVHLDGRVECREEWKSPWVEYPDGRIVHVGPASRRLDTAQHPQPPVPQDWRMGWSPFLLRDVGHVAPSIVV